MSAKKSRASQSQPSPQTKSKKQSGCLCCFGGNASEPSSEIYLDRGVEDTDLLVEKMVVQRVPVRLFATEEDYRKIEAERSERESQLSTARPFEKYYCTLPKTDIKVASTAKIRPIEESAISLHDVKMEVLEENFPFREKKSEDSERIPTLSKRLSKEACPVNPPRKLITGAITNTPSHWKHLGNNSEEVKSASATLQVGGRELTPEMKDTLLMLGSAKKPANYRLQKHFGAKRKTTGKPSSVAIETNNNTSYHDYVVSSKPANLPDGCTWQKSKLFGEKTFPTFNPDLLRDSRTIASVKQKLLDRCTYPNRNQSKRYGGRSLHREEEEKEEEEEERIVEPLLVEPSRGKTGHRKKCFNEEDLVETPQITEINQMKGSYLKWRIIIRHRNESDE